MPIICLEGPDLVGKTTLAKHIAKCTYNAVMLKQGPPSGMTPILQRYLLPIQHWMIDVPTEFDKDPPTLILDRWHMGELVYGPLLRGKSLLTYTQANYIDMVLQTFGCTFAYVTASLDVLQARYDERGDDLVKRGQLADISHAYDGVMRHPHRRHHWAISSSHVPITDIITALCMPAPMTGRYIGPLRPRVLLLGDERSNDTFIFPFVPARATSGHWLMDAFMWSDIDHMQVGIVNASELTPAELAVLWIQLSAPPVIPLGRNAEKQWAKTGRSQARYLHHPQYMRRFQHTAMTEYGQAIKEVMDHG